VLSLAVVLRMVYSSLLASISNIYLYSLQKMLSFLSCVVMCAVAGNRDRTRAISSGGFMLQYIPLYTKAFGYPAWSLHGSIDDARIQDLLWRKVQTDPDLVFRLATLLDPGARLVGEDIFLSDETSISLHPESCGAYATRRNGQNIYLSENSIMDQELISKAEQHPSSCGYYLGPLFQRNMGWLSQKVCSNLLQRLEMSLTLWDSYVFSRKPCHNNVLMQESYKNEALHLIEKFKNAFKCTSRGPYWYLSEDGSIVFGTVYFINNENYFSKFPISAWEKIGLIPIIIVLIFSIRLEKSLFMICMILYGGQVEKTMSSYVQMRTCVKISKWIISGSEI